MGLCPGGGGGGHFYICAYWVCAARETPIFSPKFPLRSITILHFCRSGDHHFRNFFTLKPFIARVLARRILQSVPETPPSRSSSIRSSPFFTLPRHIISWGECPDPPPPPPRVCQRNVIVHAKSKLHVSRQ